MALRRVMGFRATIAETFERWDAERIARRQAALARMASTVWRISQLA